MEGIIIPFRIRDSYKTWWDERSDLGFDLFGEHDRPVFFYHLLQSGFDERMGTLPFGSLEQRVEGWFGRAKLEVNQVADAFLRLVDKGRAMWSTGAYEPGIRVRADGYMLRWPLVELTGLDVDHAGSLPGTTKVGHVRGLLPRDVSIDDAVELRRSWFVFNQTANLGQQQGGQPPATTPAPAAPATNGQQQPQQPQQPQQSQPITVDMLTLLQQLAQGQQQQAQQIAALRSQPAIQLPASEPLKPQPPIQVASKYDAVSLWGMLFWDQAQQQLAMRKGVYRQRSEEFMRALVDKMRGLYEQERDKQPQFPMHVPLRCVDHIAYDAWHAKVPFLRANEAMQSTLAGSGDEMVPTLLSSVAWYVFMLQSKVLGLLDVFDMPSNPFTQVTIAGGPTTRRVSEATDQSQAGIPTSPIPASKPTTALITWSAGKIGALCLVSDELWQDAGLSVADVNAQQFARNAARDIDYVLINGSEDATATNISHYGADPTGTAYDKILILDGIRKNAIANSDYTDLGGALAIGTQLAVREKMGSRGIIGTDQANLVCLMDPPTYYDLLAVAEFRTYDKAGPDMTIVNGEVGRWDGVPVVVTDELEAADADGHISSTHNDSGNGQLAVIHRKICRVGRRRDVVVEQGPVPHTGLYAASWTVRLDLQFMEAGGTALVYDIG